MPFRFDDLSGLCVSTWGGELSLLESSIRFKNSFMFLPNTDSQFFVRLDLSLYSELALHQRLCTYEGVITIYEQQ